MCAECDTFQSVLFFSNEEMPQICNSRDCPFRLAVKKNCQKGNGKGRFAVLQQRVARFQFHSFSVHTVALHIFAFRLLNQARIWMIGSKSKMPET